MKQNQKDILLVQDEKTGEIGVVAGLKKDGTPNLEKSNGSNKDFLLFDRGGDMFDNFFKNYMSQCKEPNRFGFYRVAADGAEQIIEALKQLLKDPDANAAMLAPHKIDTAQYEPKPQNQQSTQQGYQPIDAESIDWESLQKSWGIKREDLEASGDLNKMLNYGKSDLVSVSPKFGDTH